MEFVADLIGSLAWPLVVGTLALVVWRSTPRDDRASFLRRLRKAPGIELDSAVASIEAATNPDATVGIKASSGAEEDADLPFDQETRLHMDMLIEAAARWGWVRAGRAADDFPRPLVAWTPHGATIVRASVTGAHSVTFAPGSFRDAHTGRPNTSGYTRAAQPEAPSIEEPER